MSLGDRAIYQLVVGQLADDGFHGASQAVASATGTPPPKPGSLPPKALSQLGAGQLTGAELERWREGGVRAYRSAWTAPAARAVARFSADGRQLAIGTADGQVRVHDAESLVTGVTGAADGAALRSYTEHGGAVNAVDFHPSGAVAVSASEDCTMRFYEWRHAMPSAARTCTDTHPARAVAFHPAGEHLLVGTTHAAIHLYDVSTFRCFLSPVEAEHHGAPTADARWSADGSTFASCAGVEVKIWDGGSCRCVATLGRAHGGAVVGGVAYGRAGTHTLLTCGADSAVKLWDLRGGSSAAGRAPAALRTYEGGAPSAAGGVCALSHDGSVVYGADDATLMTWDAASGEVLARGLGHARAVRCVAACPTASAVATCAEDGQVCAWTPV